MNRKEKEELAIKKYKKKYEDKGFEERLKEMLDTEEQNKKDAKSDEKEIMRIIRDTLELKGYTLVKGMMVDDVCAFRNEALQKTYMISVKTVEL